MKVSGFLFVLIINKLDIHARLVVLAWCNLVLHLSILLQNKNANMNLHYCIYSRIFFTAKITMLTDLFGELAHFALSQI